MAKSSTSFICENCNYRSVKWLGQCPECKEWNTMVEKVVRDIEDKARRLVVIDDSKVMNIKDIDLSEAKRIPTNSQELNNVLGGGFIHDQAVLLAGEPGVGKSTLALQVAFDLAKDDQVLYVSAEESTTQVALRAKRMSMDYPESLMVLNSGNVDSIMSHIEESESKIVVIDSIQTIYDSEVSGVAGNIAQVKSCATKLVAMAKKRGLLLIIIGHINKDGSIAGPKVLEHLVDTVLQFEGDKRLDYRILRSIKNRFGQVGEIGIFMMKSNGLEDISGDSNIFLDSKSESSIGVARTVVMDGERPLLIEVQALVSSTVFSYPKRVGEGLSTNKLQTICAIVSKYSKVDLSDSDVYVKITGGYTVKDPVADLAVAMALISSSKKEQIRSNECYLGELSLSGKILSVVNSQKRLKEAKRFGVDVVVMNGSDKVGLKGLSVKSISHI